MTSLPDVLQRKDWIGPREDRWTDVLPQSWQSAINTSPLYNAIVGYMQPRQTFDQAAKDWQDNIPGNSPIDRIAEGRSTLAREYPKPMSPFAAEALDKAGFLANFIGPGGVRLPARPQMIRAPETGGGSGMFTPNPEKPFVAPGASELVHGGYRVPYKDGELSYKMMDDGTANLSIYTMPQGRGQGEARKALQNFISAADAAKQPLSLEVSPGAPGVSADRLRKLYSDMGFEGPDYYMVRQPGSAPLPEPGGVKLPPPAAPKPQGIKAYHGSPHDFDRFDLSKIGTGEGAQAYGRGLYFAEAEGTAKSYRNQLGTWDKEIKRRASDQLGINLTDAGAIDFQRAAMADQSDPIRAAKLIQMRVPETRALPIEKVAEVAKQIHGIETPGRMYEVRINAEPEKFLDWDKPLAQQPESVRKLVQGLPDTATGEQAYRALAERKRTGARSGDPLEDVLLDIPITDGAGAASHLREAGIPGIKYKDAMSRDGGGPGTSNFVVFDDKLIEILRKYGLLPPMVAGGALMGGSSEAGASPAP